MKQWLERRKRAYRVWEKEFDPDYGMIIFVISIFSFVFLALCCTAGIS